jgi:hypothetical protein
MFQQCELPLFTLPQNTQTATSPRVPRRRSVVDRIRYWTTNEVIQLLNLDSPYALRKSKANGGAYRSDRYVAIPAGRNRWELFKRFNT